MATELEGTNRLNHIIGPFYCQAALRLCIEARGLYASGDEKKAAEICSFVATLCSENDFKTCIDESAMCAQASRHYLKGRGPEESKKGNEICIEARRLCPQNHMVAGA